MVSLCLLAIENKNIAATTQDVTDTSIGNIYNTDGTLNKVNLINFLSKINFMDIIKNKPVLTSSEIAKRANTEGAFVFEMGYYTDLNGNINVSKPIKWQAVYSTNGYLTIWMAQNYTADYFNGYSASSSGWGGSEKYETLSNYSVSTLRKCALGIYDKLSSKFNEFSDLIVSPNDANATWQSTQPDLNCAKTSSDNVYIHHNGLNSYSGSYTGWSNSKWDSSNPPYKDKFWIPSWYEVYRKTSDTSNSFSSMPNPDGGLWGLSNKDLAVESKTLDDKSYTNFWLRSGNSTYDTNATCAYGSGAYGYSWVYGTYGVRPACHMNLNYFNNSGYIISSSIVNSDETKATLDKLSGYYLEELGELSFTYTSQPNYYINTMKINGTNVSILETAPSSFANTTGCKYKCYRNANKVIVTIANLTQDTTIEGSVATLYSVVSNDPTLVLQETTTSRANWFTSYTKIVAKYEQNQNIRLCIDGVYAKLVGQDGNGVMSVSNGKASYSHSAFNNYISIELNLPNGPHAVSIDHYTGASSPVNISVTGGSALQTVRIIDNDLHRIVITPDSSDNWVHDFSINNSNVLVEYYKAEVYGIGDAVSIEYTAKDKTNSFVVEIYGLYGAIDLTFNLVNTAPNLKIPPTSGGAAVTGTVATANVGGEVRMVGNDIANGNDEDTVTFIAVAYGGYKFVNWVNANDESEVFGDSTSIKLNKNQINGKIIKAIFVSTTTSSDTNSNLNNTNDII